MLKYMYDKNPRLMRICIIIFIIIFIWGALLVTDAIQKEVRAAKTTEPVEVKADTEEFRAYDVDGLTDEQIEEWIKEERRKRGIE